MDVLYARYKDEIIDPWIRGLTDKGERSVIGTIKFNSKVAKELVASGRERAENRYKREPEAKEETVAHLIAIWEPRSGQRGVGRIVRSPRGFADTPRTVKVSCQPFYSGRLLTLSI